MPRTARTVRPHSPVLSLHSMTEHAPVSPPAMVEDTDAELVARACHNDASAFEALARRHYGSAFAVALAVLGNHADAEDVCHDALVRALARLEDCRSPERFARWLMAIVRNHARNHLVRPDVRRSAELDGHVRADLAPASRPLEMHDLRVQLSAALQRLSPVQREVVLLHDLHDWTHEAIAESIGTSAGMSRQHLFKARRILRHTLGSDLLREQFNG